MLDDCVADPAIKVQIRQRDVSEIGLEES